MYFRNWQRFRICLNAKCARNGDFARCGFLISGVCNFILFLSARLGSASGVKVAWWRESIYSGMGLTKSPNEFTEDVNILDGSNAFSGLALRSGDYEGEIQDIATAPGRGKQMSGSLTHGENSN